MLSDLETSKDFVTSVDNRALSDTEMENVAGGFVYETFFVSGVLAGLGARLGQYVGEHLHMSFK